MEREYAVWLIVICVFAGLLLPESTLHHLLFL